LLFFFRDFLKNYLDSGFQTEAKRRPLRTVPVNVSYPVAEKAGNVICEKQKLSVFAFASM